jgi:protease IV
MDIQPNTEGFHAGENAPDANQPGCNFTSTPAMPPFAPTGAPQNAPPKTSGWRIFLNILLGLSIIGNIFLFLAVLGLGTVAVTSGLSGSSEFVEKVLIEGPAAKKIAVINLDGIIQDKVSEEVRLQIKTASESSHVKGVILRINSPGGMVSSSDQIHYYLTNLRKETGIPVVAFMQSVAASGGYYSAVACDHILAEPTAITGSIGVILNHLVFKDLLETKLGILPEVIKSGPKKDWPSMYTPMTDEQKQYLNDKLIIPTYKRFVDLVSEGRKAKLTPEQVRHLADGSIYTAQEALDNGLIDEIGYFQNAVDAAEKLANIKGARVVEYQRPLSWLSSLGAASQVPVVDAKLLEKMLIPQLMYMWDGKN